MGSRRKVFVFLSCLLLCYSLKINEVNHSQIKSHLLMTVIDEWSLWFYLNPQECASNSPPCTQPPTPTPTPRFDLVEEGKWESGRARVCQSAKVNLRQLPLVPLEASSLTYRSLWHPAQACGLAQYLAAKALMLLTGEPDLLRVISHTDLLSRTVCTHYWVYK